ncbi:hypothetical protein V5O48_018627, partial [Marasmius crinis-equi]
AQNTSTSRRLRASQVQHTESYGPQANQRPVATLTTRAERHLLVTSRGQPSGGSDNYTTPRLRSTLVLPSENPEVHDENPSPQPLPQPPTTITLLPDTSRLDV